MQKTIKLMSGMMLGSFLFCVSTDLVVSAEEVPTDILSEPVNDARDSKEKLNEVLNKASEPSSTPETELEETEVIEPSQEEPSENITPPNETTNLDTSVDTEAKPELEQPELVEEETGEAGISTDIPPKTGEEESVEIPEEGTEEDTDNSGDLPGESEETDETETPLEGENENEGTDDTVEDGELTPPTTIPPPIQDLDDKVKDAFKPIEMPEENSPVEVPKETKEDNPKRVERPETSIQEPNNNLESDNKEVDNKITKYDIERLPETGIADDIELIYIFEIVILGFALLMLSFKPTKKSRNRR